MKIVYMGTPEFAVYPLEKLIVSSHEVGYVVCQPDMAKDRGKKVKFSPVKEVALKNQIRVLQPEKIKNNEEFINELRQYSPDLIVVAAYGKILPREILMLPRLGCINIHASILPRWRGAAPIQRAIMAGDEETGVSLMQMSEGLDTGDVIAKSCTEIGKKNGADLHRELSIIGGNLLIDNLDDIMNNTVNIEKQDESKVTYADMLSKSDGLLDFFKDAKKLERQIRGLYPWPGTYTYRNGEVFKIWDAEALEGIRQKGNTPGRILNVSNDGIEVATAKGSSLLIKVVQVPNKKRMSVEDFIKGNDVEIGSMLG